MKGQKGKCKGGEGLKSSKQTVDALKRHGKKMDGDKKLGLYGWKPGFPFLKLQPRKRLPCSINPRDHKGLIKKKIYIQQAQIRENLNKAIFFKLLSAHFNKKLLIFKKKNFWWTCLSTNLKSCSIMIQDSMHVYFVRNLCFPCLTANEISCAFTLRLVTLRYLMLRTDYY